MSTRCERAKRFLEVKRVAIVGATDRTHHTRAVLEHLQAYGLPRDHITLVSSAHEQVGGEPCVPSLDAVAETPTLVISLAPARRVADALRDVGAHRVAAMMSIAEGFADAGEEGRRLQDEVVALAEELDVAVLGPNTLGYLAPGFGVGAWVGDWTGWDLPTLASGRIAIVAQSSGILNLLLQLAARRRMGIRAAVSVGNEAVVDAGDFIETFADDPATAVIGVVLESTSRPKTLVTALQAARLAGKRVVVLKFGSSALGMHNAVSHSGRLATDGRTWEALFSKLGVVTVEDLDQFLDGLVTVDTFVRANYDGSGGLGVLSVSGGDCGLASDLCERVGLRLATLSESTRARMRSAEGNRTGAASNPVDLGLIGHSTDVVRHLSGVVVDDDDVGVVVARFALPWKFSEKVAAIYEMVHQEASRAGVPLLVMSRAAEPLDQAWFEHFAARGVPLVTSYGLGLRMLRDVLAGMARPSWHDSWVPTAVPEVVRSLAGDRFLEPAQAAAWLSTRGLPWVAGGIADDVAGAVELATAVGFPVCVKGVVPGVVHKNEAGLVHLGLGEGDVEAACKAVAEQARTLDGEPARFEVQRMVPPGLEVMVGMVRDPLMGPVLTLGAGGTAVERTPDVCCLVPPVAPDEVAHCMRELRMGPAFFSTDVVGEAQREEFFDLVARFSRVVVDERDLSQVDLNPVVLSGTGEVQVVDAVVAMATGSTEGEAS